ncbi:DUF721 domain-containing protein [bacterium]|nr:DUF721 domain-containing protein [bacterium]
MSYSEDGNQFTKLEKAVENVLVENKLQSVLYFTKIHKYWEVIVGKPLAGKTSPAKLVKKTLIVMVEDAAYSHHLKYFEKNIIDLIASPEICGEGIVRKVVFKVKEKSLIKQKQVAQPESKEQVPIKIKPIKNEAAQTAEIIKDKRLKASFSRFMSSNIPDKDTQ